MDREEKRHHGWQPEYGGERGICHSHEARGLARNQKTSKADRRKEQRRPAVAVPNWSATTGNAATMAPPSTKRSRIDVIDERPNDASEPSHRRRTEPRTAQAAAGDTRIGGTVRVLGRVVLIVQSDSQSLRARAFAARREENSAANALAPTASDDVRCAPRTWHGTLPVAAHGLCAEWPGSQRDHRTNGRTTDHRTPAQDLLTNPHPGRIRFRGRHLVVEPTYFRERVSRPDEK